MNFLLDTDTCSAHMRRPAQLAHRFIQYSGGLAIPTIVLAEPGLPGEPDTN
jgi:tRNA(fMet)-specific endonuclease VapC